MNLPAYLNPSLLLTFSRLKIIFSSIHPTVTASDASKSSLLSFPHSCCLHSSLKCSSSELNVPKKKPINHAGQEGNAPRVFMYTTGELPKIE